MRAGQAADLLQSSSCRAPGSAAAGRLPSGSSKVSCGKRAKPEFQVLSRSNLVRPPGACLWLRSVQETCTSHLAWHLVDVSLFFRNFLLDERTGGGGGGGGEFHPRTKFVWPYPFPGADSLHGCGCNQANPMFPGAPRAVSAIHNLSDPFGADRASSLRKSASPTPPVCPACLLEPQARTSSGGLGKGRQREAWQAVPERVFLFGLSSALQWRPHGWHELQAGHSEARRGF